MINEIKEDISRHMRPTDDFRLRDKILETQDVATIEITSHNDWMNQVASVISAAQEKVFYLNLKVIAGIVGDITKDRV